MWTRAVDPLSGVIPGQWLNAETGEVFFGDVPPGGIPGAAVRPSDPWGGYFYDEAIASGATPEFGAAINQLSPAVNLVNELGLDPAQSLDLYRSGMQANYGSPYFAGATDLGNQSLKPGWGMLGILEGTNNLTPDRLTGLQQYVDQGYQDMNAQRTRDKADFNKSLMTAAGLLGAVTLPGLMGMYPGQGGMSIFGADAAAPVAESVGGTWNAGGSPVNSFWSDLLPPGSGIDGLYMPSPVTTGADAGFWSGLNASDLGWGTGTVSGFWGGMPSSIDLGSSSFLDDLLKGSKTLSSLFGSGANAIGGSGFNLGGLLGGGIDLAAGLAPSLAAISYAKNQGPFDTSRLEDIYNRMGAQTFDYDMNTQRGLDQLTNNLTRRGVMGSSFGQNDLTNFNTARELGRNDLLSAAAGNQANVANAILNADVKSRLLKNDLYGRALSSIGSALGGRR